jgi:transcriptional regulator with PAS, ATPase and Fis domain
VVPLHIQPLRERKVDVLPLIFHFLEKFNETYQRKKVLSPEVIEAICTYDFPGNIRELANIIERLVVVAEKSRIELRDLPDIVLRDMTKTVTSSFVLDGISLKEALESYERFIIDRTMKKYGSQREVAKVLKVDQATISRKARKYSIYRPDVILHNSM